MKNILSIFLLVAAAMLAAAPLKLAENGKTDYSIVVPPHASNVDKYAAQELAFFLKEITGAQFPIVNSAKSPAIYVGASKVSLPDDVCKIVTSGKDLRLYGGGVHGTLWAVYELLENSFGCMFLNGFGDFYAPKKAVLTLPDTNKKVQYAFRARAIMIYFYKDGDTAAVSHYRNRQNLLLKSHNHPHNPGKNKGIENFQDIFTSTHSLGQLIPAGVKEVKTGYHAGTGILDALPELRDKKYFITNPEFFSMNDKGQRVPNRQLCFSNPALRKELQKNVRMYYDRMFKKTGLKGHVDISCNDTAYRLCFCKNCVAMEKKYGTAGAPLIYTLIELAKNNPDITFRTLAYQRTQSQKPPTGMGKIPENLLIIFAPINGDYANPLDRGKENKIDYADFKGWVKLTRFMLFWYYPNVYNRSPEKFFLEPPNGAIKRIARDIQIMRDHQILGTYFEHDAGGITYCTNFSEMQAWIMLKLFQNPDQDLDSLITKYLNVYYGPAAPILKKYHSELVAELDKYTAAGGMWNYRSIDAVYLTKNNLLRWDKMLDEAEKTVSGEYAFRVRLLRMGLDNVIVAKIDHQSDMRIARLKKTLQELESKRAVKVNWKKFETWCNHMKNRSGETPLPVEFAAISGAIVLPVPERGATVVPLKGANLGRAFKEKRAPGKNFSMGLYDQVSKKYPAYKNFKKGDIGRNFEFYLINSKPVTLTPSTLCFGGSWRLNYFVGKAAVSRDDANSLKREFYIFVSLREEADGTIYSDRACVIPADRCPGSLLVPREPGKTSLPESLRSIPGLIEITVAKTAKAKVEDPAANFYRALAEKWDGKATFRMGIYHGKTKTYSSTRILKAAEVPADGKYHLVRLNKVPDSIVKHDVFFAGAWKMAFQIGWNTKPDTKYIVFVSLKREANRLLCDKLVLVPGDKCPAELK
ncbi:MAG: DUF4838 domain-containing protein [Lentisphaerae bacterium]|nr:DUF4838 domain-containing protein [Lentisphaerota bacterium]